ncbi:hypothetical protein O988_06411, partial [Pseudogymnoascus sp. VKM F-3808]
MQNSVVVAHTIANLHRTPKHLAIYSTYSFSLLLKTYYYSYKMEEHTAPHAEASTFKEGTGSGKQPPQPRHRNQLTTSHSNLANASSLLWHAYKSLPAPLADVNWTGFYVLDKTTPSQLILGPFHGQVACQTIAFTRGVCGYAATHKTIQVVNNVEAFPNHIACDGATKSEVVVPLLVDGEVVAVLDVDCAVLSGFDEEDALALYELAELLAKGCDCSPITRTRGPDPLFALVNAGNAESLYKAQAHDVDVASSPSSARSSLATSPQQACQAPPTPQPAVPYKEPRSACAAGQAAARAAPAAAG